MDKVLVSHTVGGDGGSAALGIDDEGASLAVEIKYPLAKVMDPLNAVIDKAIDTVESTIPGDWDKAVLEPIRAAAKAELLTLLASTLAK